MGGRAAMTNYTTMRVPTEAWERAKDEKRDGETWGEYLQRCTNATPETPGENVDVQALADELKNQLSMANEPGVDMDVDGLIERLERIERAASTVEERTGRIERQLEGMGGR